MACTAPLTTAYNFVLHDPSATSGYVELQRSMTQCFNHVLFPLERQPAQSEFV